MLQKWGIKMGLFSNLPVGMWRSADGMVEIHKDKVKIGKESFEWSPEMTCSIESGEELARRVTATRVLLVGVFAWAFKKKTGGTRYLVVEGPEFFWSTEVERKKVAKAQKFRQVFEDTKRKALSVAEEG